MKTIHLSLTVPDELDPEEMVSTMYEDFLDNNQSALVERYPKVHDLMGNIEFRVIDCGVYKVLDQDRS